MRWGLVGTRGLVSKGCLPAFEQAEVAQLAAVLSADAARAEELGAEHGLQTATADLDGAIGAVSVSHTYYGRAPAGPPREWRQSRATAHWGALADVGTHHLDLLRMLIGEVEEARGVSGHQLGFETEDVVAAALRLEGGVVATLTISTNVSVQSTRVEVHGTEGALVAVDTSPAGQGTLTLLRPGEEPEDLTGERPMAWTAQLETVTRVAAGEDLPYASGEDGARNLEVMEQIVA